MHSLALLSALAATALAVPRPHGALFPRQGGTGTGPYPAKYTTASGLKATIYTPVNPPSTPMPVMVWGEGGCGADGLSNSALMYEIASHGFLVVADGNPGGQGSTTDQDLANTITWAKAHGGQGVYGNIDSSNIAAAGWSCGGLQAYNMNDQVKTILIFDSGLLSNYGDISKITKPIIYHLGGTSDIAYQNGERDYAALNSGLPKWLGNQNSYGHAGGFSQPNGGKYAKSAVAWLKWTLQGDADGKAYFTGSGAANDGYTGIMSANLDKIPVGSSSTDPVPTC